MKFSITANKRSQSPLPSREALKSGKKKENEEISDDGDDDNDDDDGDDEADPDADENDFEEGDSGGDNDLGERNEIVKRSAISLARATSPAI